MPAIIKIACGVVKFQMAKLCPSETVTIWEGRRRLRIWSFRRPGGNGMELASSDAMAVRFALPVLHSPLSFLGRLKPFFSFWKRKKRMGLKTLPVCAERRQPPLGKGAFEWTESSAPAGVKVNFKSCKRADEGIGPYKHNRAHSGKTIKRMPCSSLCPLCKKETRQKVNTHKDNK